MKPFFSVSEAEIFQELGTSSEGLSVKEAKERLEKFGKNALDEKKISKWALFFKQFHNFLIYILLAAATVSILVSAWKDVFVILAIIFINSVVGFWQELKAEISIAALKKLTESQNKVIRAGRVEEIPSSLIVPGDILLLYEGQLVTADVRLIETHGLMINEASMTGESAPVIKNHQEILAEETPIFELKNSALAGTIVVRGSGKGVVTKTGKDTYLASIAEKSQEKSPDSPFTKAIKVFAKRYVLIHLALFISLGVIGVMQKRALLDLAYILLASLVSAAPEGLPIVITLVMVVGALNLSRKKALVRHLASVETLGSANVIASDKTGTITTGNLVVKEVFSLNDDLLKNIAILCNDAREQAGDPLDIALLEWGEEDGLIEKSPRKWGYAFDAKLMLMATLNQINGKDTLLVKGAYESLKQKGSNQNDWGKLDAAHQKLLDQGLRVLSFGSGEWMGEDPDHWKITIAGLIGFLDPPKEGVIDAVESAKKAGIRLMMITGDHPMTAKAIAKEVEIYQEGDAILTGSEIESMDDGALLESFQKTSVLARILPEHKYRVVKLLQKQGQVVAVTGDGVNDVPALQAADLGIAMGSGTEAAKSAAKMIITDNNLNVIVEAIHKGRVIADNMRKIIYYLVSTSLQEIILISLSIFSSLTLPLTAIQILWINIVTDGTQDKTFAFIQGEGDVMKRGPKDPAKQFFDRSQILRILVFGGGTGLALFGLYLYLLPKAPFQLVSSVVFTSLVVSQWANSLQAQKEKEPFFKNVKLSFTINPYLYVGLALGVTLQWMILYLIPDFFDIEPIPFQFWKYPILFFVFAFLLVEVRKWVELLWKNYSAP